MPVEHVYLDEDVPFQLADLLGANGVVVHLPREIDTVSAADPIHLQRCARERWVLITQNRRDFRRLHWLWMTFHQWQILPQPHGGILTLHEQEPALPIEWAPAIHELLESRQQFDGLMFMWRKSSGRWESQPVAFM